MASHHSCQRMGLSNTKVLIGLETKAFGSYQLLNGQGYFRKGPRTFAAIWRSVIFSTVSIPMRNPLTPWWASTIKHSISFRRVCRAVEFGARLRPSLTSALVQADARCRQVRAAQVPRFDPRALGSRCWRICATAARYPRAARARHRRCGNKYGHRRGH